jgi:hypothetical protein
MSDQNKVYAVENAALCMIIAVTQQTTHNPHSGYELENVIGFNDKLEKLLNEHLVVKGTRSKI